ncbi:putative zinc transporter [Senna tora]|uniref:Putative zinc transporter n=1 Tax=Senna tora TaxID=362788 RepID=A0A834XIQ2_9FABA|nr:putative zinc transporter [Senna tora]
MLKIRNLDAAFATPELRQSVTHEAYTHRLPHKLNQIALVLSAWRPLELLLSSNLGFFPILSLLSMGAAFIHLSSSGILKLTAGREKASVNDLPTPTTGFPLSFHTLQSFISCGAVAFHALAEGLALKAHGPGRNTVLPVSLHGLPRGVAAASCIYGATDSWQGSLAMAAIVRFMSPISSIGAILAGIDCSGLEHLMVFASGGLIPSFGNLVKRALCLDKRKSTCGLIMGIVFATSCLTLARLVCFHTSYCNSAPEAVG